MKRVALILVAAMTSIAACGGSDSGGSVGQINASESPASTLVSSDGHVVAGAVFGGGVQSNSSVPIKSVNKNIAADVLIQRIAQDLRGRLDEMSQVKTVTTTTNPQNTAASIKFVDEKVAVGKGFITYNGEFSGKRVDDLNVVGTGTLSAKQDGVHVSVQRDGSTYSEVVDGTVTFDMSLALTYTLNASGQYNGYKTIGDAILKGSDVKVTGDVSGSVLNMNAKYHYEGVDDVNGTTLTDKSCGGYLSVEVNGEQSVCGVLSSCDGCEKPGL